MDEVFVLGICHLAGDQTCDRFVPASLYRQEIRRIHLGGLCKLNRASGFMPQPLWDIEVYPCHLWISPCPSEPCPFQAQQVVPLALLPTVQCPSAKRMFQQLFEVRLLRCQDGTPPPPYRRKGHTSTSVAGPSTAKTLLRLCLSWAHSLLKGDIITDNPKIQEIIPRRKDITQGRKSHNSDSLFLWEFPSLNYVFLRGSSSSYSWDFLTWVMGSSWNEYRLWAHLSYA